MTVAYSRLPGWTGFDLLRLSILVTTLPVEIMYIMRPVLLNL